MRLLRGVVAIYHNVFNIKFALISMLANGAIVVCLNWSYGPREFVLAGFWQALASFLSTGITARIVQHFSVITSPLPSYFWGSLIPALLTFAFSFGVHVENGTPELLASWGTPTAISFITSFVTNYITRRGYLLPGNHPKKKGLL